MRSIDKTHHSSSDGYRQQQALLEGKEIFRAGDYVQEVSLRPVREGYHLIFTSRMTSARRPDERRKNFEMFLDGPALAGLRDLLTSTTCVSQP